MLSPPSPRRCRLSCRPPPEAEEVLSSAYPGKSYSPCAGRGFASRPYWGDSHLHTSLSMDAGAFGNRLGLRDAYRFARGEEVVASAGMPVKLSRPLDWLVIADHSDNMGFPICTRASRTSWPIPRGRTGMTGFRRARASASRSSLSVCSHRAISQKP